jgi:hypothetical protein
MNDIQSQNNIQRQGDLLFIPAEILSADIPTDHRLAAVSGRITLALGEATGHHHAVLATPDVEVYAADLAEEADRFVRALSAATIVHDQHGTLTLPPGDWVVRRKREHVYGSTVRLLVD